MRAAVDDVDFRQSDPRAEPALRVLRRRSPRRRCSRAPAGTPGPSPASLSIDSASTSSAVAVALGERLQVRVLALAERAPGRPELDHDDRARELDGGERAAVEQRDVASSRRGRRRAPARPAPAARAARGGRRERGHEEAAAPGRDVHWLTGDAGSISSATTSRDLLLGQDAVVAEARHVRAGAVGLRVPHLAPGVAAHVVGVAADLAEVVERRADGAEADLLLRELVAGVAVGADRPLRVVGELEAGAALRDLLAALPVAEVLAVGRPADRAPGSPSRSSRPRPSAVPCRRTGCTAPASRPGSAGRASPGRAP